MWVGKWVYRCARGELFCCQTSSWAGQITTGLIEIAIAWIKIQPFWPPADITLLRFSPRELPLRPRTRDHHRVQCVPFNKLQQCAYITIRIYMYIHLHTMERRSSRCTSGGCSSGIIVISYPIRAAYILYSRVGVRVRVFIVHIMYGNHVEFVCGSGARTGKRERRGICRGKKKKKNRGEKGLRRR